MATKGDLLPDGSYRLSHECPPELEPGLIHVECPSGYHRDIEGIDLQLLAVAGWLPNPLAMLVRKGETPTDEDQDTFQGLKSVVVAAFCRPEQSADFVMGFKVDEGGSLLRDDSGRAIPVRPCMPRHDRMQLWLAAIDERTDPIKELMKYASFRDGSVSGVVPADVPSAGNRSSRRARAV